MTRPPLTRTAAGHLWTLTGDRWTADPDLVVTTSGAGKHRDYSPGRDPGRQYGALSVACEAEVRIADAQRERVLAEMEREERERALAALDLARAIKAREREAAESARAAERNARAERRTALRVAAGLTVAWLLVCAGIVGWAL